MNIMGIRIFKKLPKCISMYNLRAQNTTESESLLSFNLSTKTDSFWNPINWGNRSLYSDSIWKMQWAKHLTIEEDHYIIFLLTEGLEHLQMWQTIGQMLLDIQKPLWASIKFGDSWLITSPFYYHHLFSFEQFQSHHPPEK